MKSNAPTEDAEDGERDAFYDQLQKLVDDTPVHDVLLILNDLHSKVRVDNTGKESSMGKQEIGDSNNNGDRWSTFTKKTTL